MAGSKYISLRPQSDQSGDSKDFWLFLYCQYYLHKIQRSATYRVTSGKVSLNQLQNNHQTSSSFFFFFYKLGQIGNYKYKKKTHQDYLVQYTFILHACILWHLFNYVIVMNQEWPHSYLGGLACGFQKFNFCVSAKLSYISSMLLKC